MRNSVIFTATLVLSSCKIVEYSGDAVMEKFKNDVVKSAKKGIDSKISSLGEEIKEVRNMTNYNIGTCDALLRRVDDIENAQKNLIRHQAYLDDTLKGLGSKMTDIQIQMENYKASKSVPPHGQGVFALTTNDFLIFVLMALNVVTLIVSLVTASKANTLPALMREATKQLAEVAKELSASNQQIARCMDRIDLKMDQLKESEHRSHNEIKRDLLSAIKKNGAKA